MAACSKSTKTKGRSFHYHLDWEVPSNSRVKERFEQHSTTDPICGLNDLCRENS